MAGYDLSDNFLIFRNNNHVEDRSQENRISTRFFKRSWEFNVIIISWFLNLENSNLNFLLYNLEDFRDAFDDIKSPCSETAWYISEQSMTLQRIRIKTVIEKKSADTEDWKQCEYW